MYSRSLTQLDILEIIFMFEEVNLNINNRRIIEEKLSQLF